MAFLGLDPQEQDDDERTDEERARDEALAEDDLVAFYERYELV